MLRQNMLRVKERQVLIMEIKTTFGVLDGVFSANYYEDGSVKDCILDKANMVFTQCGPLIPQYGEENVRRKYTKSISFHPDGSVKSILLETQSEITTPIGEFPAELVTFYETGELKRFFPVNGKISGYWSEQDEKALNIPFNFSFEFGDFTAMLVGICFYPGGDIRSMTLFPGEIIKLATPAGEISVRNGFSLHENGKLQSVEPSVPVKVTTPIGVVSAFDTNASGISADENSLVFSESGEVLALTTSTDVIAVYDENKKVHFIKPVQLEVPELREDEEDEVPTLLPIRMEFGEDAVTFVSETVQTFKISTCKFSVMKSDLGCSPSSGCSDCSSCSLCH